MSFSGFTPEQFEVFEIPAFGERMAAIRTILRPGLLALGQDLAPSLSEMAGHPLYPHVALHARRKVNPPEETWVAFARSSRGYKACAHFEVGLGAAGLFIGLVLKDESTDKAALGKAIVDAPAKAQQIARKLKGYDWEEIGGTDAAKASAEALCKLGDALVHRKTSAFHLTRDIPRSDRRLTDPTAVLDLARDSIQPLLPFYRWACQETG